ncbi:hypothetical protein [Anaplasma marginale]|uniref:hypothetical protein n=1 Tax=Anaplasma marginale TaxID=770 RepID=UPI0023EE3315|nr:hypothetical protein [Anaplasma marginale]
MTKGEAHKWGKAVEGVTGGDKVSQNVCKGDSGTKCGVNATSGTAQTKISAVFTEGTDTATQLSADTNNVSTSGMANNINGLSKEDKPQQPLPVHQHPSY